MIQSRLLEILRQGGVARMVNLSLLSDPWLCELAGMIGFDGVWFDMEHRQHGYETIAPLALACRSRGIDLLVRVLKTGYSSPMRCLELGANALMVPHCRSAAEARQWVDWCRYPPLGKRGFDGAGADADYGLADPVEHLRHSNRETLLVLQIEDREAVESLDEIAAVPGYDLLFVGPADLTLSYGIPFQFDHPLFRAAVDRVAAAAERHGKWWGIATADGGAARDGVDRGARLINCGSDHSWLVRGMRGAIEEYGRIAAPQAVRSAQHSQSE